jgi:hypothetical protein
MSEMGKHDFRATQEELQ